MLKKIEKKSAAGGHALEVWLWLGPVARSPLLALVCSAAASPGDRSLWEGSGLLGVFLGSQCCISSPGERFVALQMVSWVCRGDGADWGLCGLGAREVPMYSVVGLAELLQGFNLGFCSPQVL